MTAANDGSGRLFIVEQRGRITIMNKGILSDPFLNIEDRVMSSADGGGNEEGLLGLAFPPGFSEKGYFYVYYTMLSGDNLVARFSLGDNPNSADPASEEQILVLPHPTYTNHNGGQLNFGPDGYLYISTGDGGGGGDPQGNAQDPSSLNGKILRIDVENEPPDGAKYAIPGDNPFIGDAAYRPEIWALGLRNPWRFSFDRLTGDLTIADVGQNSLEEINFQSADSPGGENYGWNIFEGDQCYSGGTCDPTGMTMPIHTYPNTSPECSVTGGYVYRGSEYPDLQGLYIFGDFCSGKIWELQKNNDAWEDALLADTNLLISTFGEDEAGTLYAADMVSGVLYKIVSSESVVSFYLPMIHK
jgi:glucose/arabinose dehydrogenase